MQQPRQRGFSLLELLVALFVVVLVTSLVSLSVTSGSEDIRLESQVRELASVSQFALDEAQLLAIDYGLVIQEVNDGEEPVYRYSWRARCQQRWCDLEDAPEVLAARDFTPAVELLLELEEVSGADINSERDEDNVAPSLVFYASGEVTPGILDVVDRKSGDLLWRLEWDLLGRFNVLRKGEEETLDEDR